MTFGADQYDVEKRCIVCQSPTQSHPVPNGYLCHSCLSEHDESEIFYELPVPPVSDVTPQTDLDCVWCDATYTIEKAHDPGADDLFAGVGFPTFEQHSGMVIVSCPVCTKATEYLTSQTAAEAVADAYGLTLHEWSRRRGWSL